MTRFPASLFLTTTVGAALALGGCSMSEGVADETVAATEETDATSAEKVSFDIEELETFDEPWAMTFLPDGLMLVTEKPGTMKFFDPKVGLIGDVTGMPEVDYGGQGGLGDVVAHPDFAENGLIYISYAEAGDDDTRGAAVARGRLDCEAVSSCSFTGMDVIWRQFPKVTGRGHYGHRIAFDADGMLWISSGERQKFEPAQDMQSNMGKILRLNDDGSVPADNPFADQGGVTAQIWSLGHRNPLGIAFDSDGNLWNHEMGPAGGDELNMVVKGDNYGYPRVSNGDHYDGRDIPDHSDGDGYNAPEQTWTPVISPSSFIVYSGDRFPAWQGTGLIGGLSSMAIVNVSLDGENAGEIARYDMGTRIREVEEGPDGNIYVLEDGEDGRMMRLVPKAG
ncbi:PQQ-dependent sugar dehydrogenase [Pacificimonas sp. WHA3]|uniref:PQQ-dependent sugar dehydrogenase n=1 Tax=Pacificimonas pallii TaxID=2827236 RepID=A0ABS6SDM3_9SPHN|nr:PQQ-dependent sugar dehydrogenase [Pacificimonas pallii]MBV7255947.1 PQQ-dependent sugar dehydrogenase [Pacificimonas pallii]